MFGFAQRFGRHSQARHARARRSRSFNASVEVVEDRTLMSTLSAINWTTSDGQTHTATFGIGSDDQVYMNEDASTWQLVGAGQPAFYAKQISAGLDAGGHPEVWAIGPDNGLYLYDTYEVSRWGQGPYWESLGGYAKAISATTENTCFYIGQNNEVYKQVGTSWTPLGGYALQISAGLDNSSNPEVFAIGTDNSVYRYYEPNGWQWLGGYAKAISATVENTCFVIGKDDLVYFYDAGNFAPTGSSYAQQITAGLDAAGKPEVFAIGSDNTVSVYDLGNRGSGWSPLGNTYAREIAAPAFGVGVSSDLVYAIGEFQSSYIYHTGFFSLGNLYLELPADGGTLSAINWMSDSGPQSVTFGIGSDESVYENVNASPVWKSLHFDAKQISAGLDLAGSPEVYAISFDNHLYGYDLGSPSPSWVCLDYSTWIKAISATTGNTVFAIGQDDAVYDDQGGGLDYLGGYAQQISAGLNVNGKPEVWAIGADHGLYLYDLSPPYGFGAPGWAPMYGWVKAISATTQNTVFAIGSDDSVYANSGSGFVSLHGYAQQITAGLDQYGDPAVWAIGADDYVNGDNSLYFCDYDGLSRDWVPLGGYVLEIAAPAFGPALPENVVYAIGEYQDGYVYNSKAGWISKVGWVSLDGYLQA